MSATVTTARIPKDFHFTKDQIGKMYQDELIEEHGENWLVELNEALDEAKENGGLDRDDSIYFHYIRDNLPKEFIVKEKDTGGWTDSMILIEDKKKNKKRK